MPTGKAGKLTRLRKQKNQRKNPRTIPGKAIEPRREEKNVEKKRKKAKEEKRNEGREEKRRDEKDEKRREEPNRKII